MSGLYIAWAVLSFFGTLVGLTKDPRSGGELLGYLAAFAFELFLLVMGAVLL